METYFYAKERRSFGRQFRFREKNQVLATIKPDPSEMVENILKDPVDGSSQLSKQYGVSEVNTENAEFVSKGVTHIEGGWPKDVNQLDEEQTLRHRKKVERDDRYGIQLNKLTKKMLTAISQNSAVNIYEQYFDELEPAPIAKKSSARMVQCYHHPSAEEKSSANHISFAPEGGKEMIVAYANVIYRTKQIEDQSSYIWNLENPEAPLLKLHCDAACTRAEYNLRDGRNIVGGLINGKVCVWDSRIGGKPHCITEKEYSHRERVNTVLWLHSKSNAEFFSGSADGQLYWWDIRKFQEPIDSLVLDPVDTISQEWTRSYGVSMLEFEYTIPTKYMVGSTEGWVFVGNRKGTNPKEKLRRHYNCHDGPIRSLERNPAFVKNFLTVGDYRLKIWNEDHKDNPIVWTKDHECKLLCGTWSRGRCSLALIGRDDGILDVWDILADLEEPVISLNVSENGLCHNRSHENGSWVGCGDTGGDVFLIELSPTLSSSSRSERTDLSAMFERESNREKILEGKVREIKLKQKQQIEIDEIPRVSTKSDKSLEVDTVKRDFYATVLKEKQRRDRQNSQNTD